MHAFHFVTLYQLDSLEFWLVTINVHVHTIDVIRQYPICPTMVHDVVWRSVQPRIDSKHAECTYAVDEYEYFAEFRISDVCRAMNNELAVRRNQCYQ